MFDHQFAPQLLHAAVGPQQNGDAGAVGEGQSRQIHCQQGGQSGVDLPLQLQHDAPGGVVVQLTGNAGGESAVFLCADKTHKVPFLSVKVSSKESISPSTGRKHGEGHETMIYFWGEGVYHKKRSISRKEDDTMAKKTDLTQGSILPQLARLCIPLLAANLLQQLYNIINSLVVTYYLGQNAFAALGVAESIVNLFTYVITGACMGASVLVAQFYGEGNMPRLRRQMFVSALLIGGCVLTAVAAGQIFLHNILGLIRTPEELMGDAEAYLRVILVGMVFTFTYNYLASTLRAVGDTRTALYFLLISLGYNLLCAWLLVGVLGMGITGTAISTTTAQILSSVLCYSYIRKYHRYLKVGKADMCMDMELAGKTVNFAAVAALQQSSLYLGKLLIQGAVNGLGTASITAFTAVTRVENFVQAFGISGCEATAIFVAQNKGAGNLKRGLKGFLQGGVVQIVLGFGFTAFMLLKPELLLAPFLTKGDESVIHGVDYLLHIGGFYFLSFIGNHLVGWFRGVGRMNVTFWGTTIQVTIRVILSYLLVGVMGLGAVGLATGIGWIVIDCFHSTIFLRERKSDRLME